MKKIALALFFLTALPRPAPALPELLGGWRGGTEAVVALTPAEEDLGRWTARTYRRPAPPGVLEVHCLEGAGPGPFEVYDPDPEPGTWGESVCLRLEVAGRPAILETWPFSPPALTVAVSADVTLVLEGHLTPEELSDLARELIEGGNYCDRR